MGYDRLRNRLDESGSPTVSTLPDGSVDHFCHVTDGAAGSLETHGAFASAIESDRTAFRFSVETVEPGGQSVNAATQLGALGAAVTAYGYFDHDVFASLSVETVSMGSPVDVYVFDFADGDVMLVGDGDVAAWTLDRLRGVADLSTVFAADAICCSNWVGVPGLEAAFHELGDADLARRPLVFDPGDVVGCDNEDLLAMGEALGALQDTFDVIFNGNREEVRATATALAGPFEDDGERLRTIQDELGIAGAAMHAADEAAVATADGLVTVPNLVVDSPTRHAGGGDRFSGALAYALAGNWDWEVALSCANACASYYVETGRTAGPANLVEYLVDRSPPDA
jgi:sugar/nucleoside kinase (ribokinase family)